MFRNPFATIRENKVFYILLLLILFLSHPSILAFLWRIVFYVFTWNIYGLSQIYLGLISPLIYFTFAFFNFLIVKEKSLRTLLSIVFFSLVCILLVVMDTGGGWGILFLPYFWVGYVLFFSLLSIIETLKDSALGKSALAIILLILIAIQGNILFEQISNQITKDQQAAIKSEALSEDNLSLEERINICNKLPEHEENIAIRPRANCLNAVFYTEALKNNDPEHCTKITGESIYRCLDQTTEGLEKNELLRLCEQLKDGYQNYYIRCMIMAIEKGESAEDCELMPHKYAIRDCYNTMAKKNKDISLCQKGRTENAQFETKWCIDDVERSIKYGN